MPVPGNAILNVSRLTAYTPSCATTPVATYLHVPYNGTIRAFFGVLGGAITTANCTVTVTNLTQGTTVGTFVIPFSGSAAGNLGTGSPNTLLVSNVNQDDILVFTPSGATGASIPMHVSAALRVGY